MNSSFEALGLNELFLKAIEDLGFENPSEIQQEAIPALLTDDIDMVALAQTGTGKTAAFGFPMLQKIDVDNRTTQGLILSPTRELCLQIANEIKQYGKYLNGLNVVAVYGGASITDQARQLKRGAQIVVATPGRMKDMIGRRLVDISNIDYCVLDEADEMLNMGFYEDITDILSHTPNTKFTWLFSATMPKEVSSIANEFMYQPLEVTVGSRNTGADSVSHEYYVVNARDRYPALKRLADANPDIFSVIFCRTKRNTQEVAEKLIEDGYNAAALHGDLSQHQRDLVMHSFRSKQIQMLVATDVAARGIDVDDITHVINYQLPDEVEIYTHRSGRTGRAGKEGVSMVIATRGEVNKIRQIERIIKRDFIKKEVPSGKEICEVQLLHLANKIEQTDIHEDIDSYLPEINAKLEEFTKEELIKKFFSVEFERFYSYYQRASELGSVSGDRGGESRGRGRKSDKGVRYFLNLGNRDQLDWKSLKDFLKDSLNLSSEEVYHVDVMNNFSFFNTEAEHQELVLNTLPQLSWNGREISVEVSTESAGSGGRGGRGGGGGRRRGDRRNERRSDRRGGGRRRERQESSGGIEGSRNRNSNTRSARRSKGNRDEQTFSNRKDALEFIKNTKGRRRGRR